jgi:hypothetical protein
MTFKAARKAVNGPDQGEDEVRPPYGLLAAAKDRTEQSVSLSDSFHHEQRAHR